MSAEGVGGAPMPEEEVVETSPRGRYLRFNDVLGKGAYKEVWRSYDTIEGIEVAWNVVNLKNMPQAEKARVINEVKLLDELEHENIIDFHGSWVNRERGEVVFVTEILSSGSLKKFINKIKVVRWKIVKRWCKQILRALAYLHAQEPIIIHRDIKCDNIFINGASGDLRIGDLGLSTAKMDREGKGQSVLGTPEFMAPELYDENYDEKVDIYAFGMCALEMITKQLPYAECLNATQIYRKVTANVHPDALELIPEPTAREFVECCLDTDPNKRPSAESLLKHAFLHPDAVFDEMVIRLKEVGQLPKITEGAGRSDASLPPDAGQRQAGSTAERGAAAAAHEPRGELTRMKSEDNVTTAAPAHQASDGGSTRSATSYFAADAAAAARNDDSAHAPPPPPASRQGSPQLPRGGARPPSPPQAGARGDDAAPRDESSYDDVSADADGDEAYLADMQQSEISMREHKVRVREGRVRRLSDEPPADDATLRESGAATFEAVRTGLAGGDAAAATSPQPAPRGGSGAASAPVSRGGSGTVSAPVSRRPSLERTGSAPPAVATLRPPATPAAVAAAAPRKPASPRGIDAPPPVAAPPAAAKGKPPANGATPDKRGAAGAAPNTSPTTPRAAAADDGRGRAAARGPSRGGSPAQSRGSSPARDGRAAPPVAASPLTLASLQHAAQLLRSASPGALPPADAPPRAATPPLLPAGAAALELPGDAPRRRFEMHPDACDAACVAPGVVNVTFPYVFDGVAHSVNFDYHLGEHPAAVAGEFAEECDYPPAEMGALVEFLDRVRHDFGDAEPGETGRPSGSLALAGRSHHPSLDSLASGSGVSDDGKDDTLGALVLGVTDLTGANDGDGYESDEADDGGGDDDERRLWRELAERDYAKMRDRARRIHEDRTGKLKHSLEDCHSAHEQACAEFEQELADLDGRARALARDRQAAELDQDRLQKKFEKDMVDFERKARIELENHDRRLLEFELQYSKQEEQFRRQRRRTGQQKQKVLPELRQHAALVDT